MENLPENTKTLTLNEVLSLLHFPRKFHNATIYNLEGFLEIKGNVLNAIKNNHSIFIWGECGTGKTHLATGAAKAWMELMKPTKLKDCPLFVSTVEISSEMRDSFDNKESEEEIIKKYLKPPLLVIDDIGKEKNSQYVNETTFKIINGRYGEEKPIIITSNLSLGQISNIYGDGIASRISGMGIVIELVGNDFRIKN